MLDGTEGNKIQDSLAEGEKISGAILVLYIEGGDGYQVAVRHGGMNYVQSMGILEWAKSILRSSFGAEEEMIT